MYYKEGVEDTSNIIHIAVRVMIRVVALQFGGCSSQFHQHLVYYACSRINTNCLDKLYFYASFTILHVIINAFEYKITIA